MRAQNPDAWYDAVIASARQGPEALKPHERGQVAHIVSTIEGSRRFAQANDPPPAHWLCVFDPFTRFAKPAHIGSLIEPGPYFDPFDAYGLDSDPVPSKIDPNNHFAKRDVPSDVWNCFALTRLDRENLREESLAALRGHWSVNVPKPVTRLRNVGDWLGKVSGQPAAVWWAASQNGIHADLREQILFNLQRDGNCPATIRQAWRYIFKSWDTQRDEFDPRWFQLSESVKIDGWSDFSIRELAFTQRPFLKVTRPFFGGPRPPDIQFNPQLPEMVNLDVEYPNNTGELSIPDEYLPSLLKELRKNLELAASLEDEIGGYVGPFLSPIEPDAELHGISSQRYCGISKPVLTYVRVFRRLVEIDVQQAKHEVVTWRSNNDAVFDRLKIWACGDRRIISGPQAGKILCSLNQDAFWDESHQRDFLLALARRWPDLPTTAKRNLERRLLRGPSRWKEVKPKEFIEYKASQSLSRIYWLQGRGCQFGFDFAKEIARLKANAPSWRPEFATNAADSMESRGGWVRRDTEVGSLLSEPLATLLDKAEELSGQKQEFFVEHDPFGGLSTEKPIRAFSALVVAAKKDRYPEWAWRTFLNCEARKTDKERLTIAIAERLSRLPTDQLAELLRLISNWVFATSERLLAKRREAFFQLWARLIGVLRSEVPAAKSSVVRGDKKPDWVSESINAPVGKFAQAIMNDAQKNDLKLGAGFPATWIERVDELLSLKGDLRRHALVIFSFNMNWFFAIDPLWTETIVLSLLAKRSGDSDAIWAGFFWGAQVPHKVLYLKMKPALLDLAEKSSVARRQHRETLSAILLAGWRTIDETSGARYVTDEEMRAVLINADDEFQSRILWQLEQWSSNKEEHGSKDLLVFLQEVWPRQRAAKSSAVSARLCDLAFSNEDKFGEYVDCILPLVIPIEQGHLSIPNLRNSNYTIVDKFPEKPLALLNAVLPADTRKWPYSIDQTLERIGSANNALLKDERLIELKRRWNAR